MDKTCGSKLPSDVVASGNLMLVEFVTDGADTASGFQAIFTSGKSENKDNGKKKQSTSNDPSSSQRKNIVWGTALYKSHHFLPCFWHNGMVVCWYHLFIQADEATLRTSGVRQEVHCLPCLSDICHSKACAIKDNINLTLLLVLPSQ